jgi:hypothetical protein
MASVLDDPDGTNVVHMLRHWVQLRVFDPGGLNGAVGISNNTGTDEAWIVFEQ